MSAYGQVQIYRELPIYWNGVFTHLSFAARADAAYNSLIVRWGSNQAYTLSLTTDWQVFFLALGTDLVTPSSIGTTANPLNFINFAGATSPNIYLDYIRFTPPNNVTWPTTGYPSGGGGASGSGTNAASSGPAYSFVLSGLDALRVIM